ncbi:MAG: flagellar hook-length control protein FliK [Xanthobacteraceae bacterium]
MAFNPRSSANAGSNAPAGFKGSGNLKTNANTGFDPPTVTGGNTAPQSTPAVPPNAKAASGAKPQTAATAATTNNADTAVPVNAGLPAVQQTGLPAPVAKTSSNDGKADDGKDSDATDSAAATPTPAAPTQAQAAANPTQPVATAITVNTAENTVPAPANASAADLTVGEQTKPQTRLTTAAMAASQSAASAQDTAETASAKEAPPAGQVDNTASAGAGSTDDAAKAEAVPAHAAQPTPSQAANDPTVSAQTSGPASANADRAAAQATQPSVVSTSDNAVAAPNAQGHETAKASGVDGLPNFDFAASATSASSATAAVAPSGTASTDSVPIAGLAVAIAARAQQGSNQFDIKLSPPELGRIDVQLNVDGNGQVTSHMTVERPETLQLLQSQQPQLQNALEQAGLTTADNGLQFSLRDQSFTGQNSGSGSQSTPTQLVIPEPELAPIAATQIYTRAGLGSGIDIRV